MTVLAPNDDFVYRPMTVREPFADAAAPRYPLAGIVADAGAVLVAGKLGRVEPTAHVVSTDDGTQLPYDALVLALGAHPHARYKHAVTIDDRRIGETLDGLTHDLDEGRLKSVAFVAPRRMAWPLPLYELALMTAGRAHDMNIALQATIITPEDTPLAIFGRQVSDEIAVLLAGTGIRTITNGYAEIHARGTVLINPGARSCTSRTRLSCPS